MKKLTSFSFWELQSCVVTCLLFFAAMAITCSCSKKNSVIPPDEMPSENTLQLLDQFTLPGAVKECSGMELSTGNIFWTHNDRGNEPLLYGVDSTGQLLHTIRLTDVENNDWEDLAQDENGTIYIGDFGNNDNDRTDLAIYIVPSPEEITNNIYTPEVIQFSYEDQDAFPPPEAQHLYDTEGFFVWDNHFYLFIKDRSKPFIGMTKLYEIPVTTGVHQARLISSFTTKDKKSEGAITGADISPDGSMVALLSKDMLWIFTHFNAPQFLSGEVQQLAIPFDLQFEGVVFEDNCIIYLVNERKSDGEPQMHQFTLCK